MGNQPSGFSIDKSRDAVIGSGAYGTVYERHAQVYLKYRKIPWVLYGIDLSQGSHGLFMGLN